MTQKTFNTSYGEVSVSNAMLSSEESHQMYEGIEIKYDNTLIEVAGYYDLEELDADKIDLFIEQYSSSL